MQNKTVILKNICDFNANSLTESSPLNIIEYLDTGSITKNEINNIQILNKNLRSFPSRARRKVKNQTIIYSTVRPEQEHFGFLVNPKENLIVSTGFVTIDVKDENIAPKFIYYMLTQKYLTNYLQAVAQTNASAYPSINVDDIANLKLMIPESKKYQEKVVSALSAIDDKIDLNNRINAELEALAKTLYDYWFVQFDFPDENGRPYRSSGGKMIYNSSLKMEIPQGWEVLSLRTVASFIQRGIGPVYADRSLIVVLNQKCIRNHKIDFSKARFHDSHRKSVPAERFIQNGDILVNSTGVGTLGRLAQVWGNPKQTTIDSHITLIRPNNSLVSYAFLGCSLINREKEIENLGEGSTGQTELSRNRLGALEILCPHNSIQRNFSSIVEPHLELIYKNTQENQQLMELRDWLLPMLMNGQITVQ